MVAILEDLLLQGKLEYGVSEWSSPAFPVPKKEPGQYRLVCDYRALNAATLNDSYPLPRIEEILQRQGQYTMWSVLDMKDGYHQVPLKEEHRFYTCMSTPLGSLQWRVLVMGLKKSNAIFQRVMDWVFQEEDNVDPYIDEVPVGSTGATYEEMIEVHDRCLRKTLDILAHQQLFVKKKKHSCLSRKWNSAGTSYGKVGANRHRGNSWPCKSGNCLRQYPSSGHSSVFAPTTARTCTTLQNMPPHSLPCSK